MEFKTLEDYVGHTPLVRLKRIGAGRNNVILAKLEGNNPAGSVKDRIAKAMIDDAEQRGVLKKGSVIISLVLSIMICVVINYEDISLKLFNDTRTTVDLRNVAVEVLADTDKYDVAGVPSTVDVSLTGDATSIQVFRSKGSVQVVADLKKYSEGENIINLKVKNLPEKIEAVVDPATIDVTLSKKVTKSFTIQPELLVGSNQKVTDFETPTLDVMTVKITASQNQLNSIRIVKALIDCTGQIQDFEANATLAAYDAKGNRVNVSLSPDTVHASVKLAKNTSDKEDSE